MAMPSINIKFLQLLPTQSKSLEELSGVIFWWSNFDGKIGSSSRKDPIYNTPGVAFQEIISKSVSKGVDIYTKVWQMLPPKIWSSKYHLRPRSYLVKIQSYLYLKLEIKTRISSTSLCYLLL